MPPRRLNPRLPRDLEPICLQCLRKEPDRRYATALDLADDLRRFREGQPIAARPLSTIVRVVRWTRRRPLVAALLALLMLSLGGGLAGIAWQWREAGSQRLLAEAHARQADREKEQAILQAYRARIAAATAALQNHDVKEAASHLNAAPESLRGWEWRYLYTQLDQSDRCFPAPKGLLSVATTTDGLRLVERTRTSLRLLDEGGGEQLALHTDAAGRWYSRGCARDGTVLLHDGADGQLEVLDAPGKQVLKITKPPGASCTAIDISEDRSRVLIYWMIRSETKTILYEAPSGKELTTLMDQPLKTLALSADGSRIAAANGSGQLRLWDAASGEIKILLQEPRAKVSQLCFRADGARLATGEVDGTIREWETVSGQVVGAPLKGHTGEVRAVAYSPDGQWLSSGGTDQSVRLWRVADGEEVAVLRGHTTPVERLVFSYDGHTLASASSDGEVRFWGWERHTRLPVLRGHTRQVLTVVFSPDGRWIASGGSDDTIRLWDRRTGVALGVWSAGHGFVLALTFSPDGLTLYSAGEDGAIRVWNAATQQLRAAWLGQAKRIHKLAVSPNGRRVAAWCPEQGVVLFWDTTTGQQSASLRGLDSQRLLGDIAFSPNGQWFASPDKAPHGIAVRDAVTLQARTVLRGHTDAFAAVAFRSDSLQVVTGGWDRTLRVWDCSSGAALREMASPASHARGYGEIMSLAFHPDGRRVASGGFDRVLRLWDVNHYENMAQFSGHADAIHALTFSPDGATLASGSLDGTVRLWDTALVPRRLTTGGSTELPGKR